MIETKAEEQTEIPRVIEEFEGGPTHLYWGPAFGQCDGARPIILFGCKSHQIFTEQKVIPTIESISWEKMPLFNPCEECDECKEDTCPKPIEEVFVKGSGMKLAETLEGWFIDLGKCTPRVIPRPIVREFAKEMEKQLSANEHKGGWKTCSSGFLMDELKCNCEKLRWAMNRGDQEEVIKRSANIANFSMMLAENEGKLNHNP